MTIFEKVLQAKSLRDIVSFLRACEQEEKNGRSPVKIAWSMTYLHASDLANEYYSANKYPALTRIMDLTPDLETKNGYDWELDRMWDEIKQLINELDMQV